MEISELSKTYDSREILKSISLSVEEGEIFTLLGPSGTGKSTLLKAVAGLITIDAGAIRLRGQDITRWPIQQRNVAMVFQDYSLFPSMSVRDNISFPLVARRIKGLGSMVRWQFNLKERKNIYREVDKVLELTRMSQHAGKRPDQLSGGEQQRVAIARALVSNPDLLCLDEPFSALDKNLRQELQQEIRDLQKHLGNTILYVTHDQTEALTVSSRLAILHEGEIQQSGGPREVYEHPASVFVAQFLGDCNILGYTALGALAGGPAVCTGGGTIIAVAAPPTTAAGTIGIRPEKFHVEVLPDGSRPHLKGAISAATFFGALYKLNIRLESGEEIRAIAIDDRSERLKVGTTVFLLYNPADVFILSG